MIAVDSEIIDRARPIIEKAEPDFYGQTTDGWHLFQWDGVKWYPEPEYLEVEEYLKSQDPKFYRFLRVGEEFGDLETFGDGSTPFVVESTIKVYTPVVSLVANRLKRQ